jgi:hypothetical protein
MPSRPSTRHPVPRTGHPNLAQRCRWSAVHITRLQRRYLGGDVQASQPVRHPLSAAEVLCRDLDPDLGTWVFPPGTDFP